ncbi:hypothetical protein, unlikely [Trypanosoma brucei gambiense DAL972]|uniref:Uncharacterized protein n=1 Tax=Trypanosoma brucei gambiense (strain MHOM/CI/86/DAL972) TaxID=679716 RepID=C9ZVA3_TRYB9|nr:hypothetical protein, unlikely [Trypanosoma brucei gambiense DAL972]CBH13341.1 hypothetical protein, unlikely [Trypanosoma brucei gambiense DAL972]|eukprot:XP_011775618.1 hypothetical protein, unlikely [Trypanosoma brucei gambiense DAL972]
MEGGDPRQKKKKKFDHETVTSKRKHEETGGILRQPQKEIGGETKERPESAQHPHALLYKEGGGVRKLFSFVSASSHLEFTSPAIVGKAVVFSFAHTFTQKRPLASY